MTIHMPVKATFISITPRQREQIERLVEGLIAMLDMIDGDPCTEDGAEAELYLEWRPSSAEAYRGDCRDNWEACLKAERSQP